MRGKGGGSSAAALVGTEIERGNGFAELWDAEALELVVVLFVT